MDLKTSRSLQISSNNQVGTGSLPDLCWHDVELKSITKWQQCKLMVHTENFDSVPFEVGSNLVILLRWLWVNVYISDMVYFTDRTYFIAMLVNRSGKNIIAHQLLVVSISFSFQFLEGIFLLNMIKHNYINLIQTYIHKVNIIIYISKWDGNQNGLWYGNWK